MTATSKKTQLRPGLWQTVNDRYPGSMIEKDNYVPLAKLEKPISESKVCFVSTAGVQPKSTLPFDTVHPIGDYSFRSVPSNTPTDELEIHQIKYPTFGANEDVNVIFPIDRMRELRNEEKVGALTENFFSFIGYNMDPERLERTLAEDLADAIEAEKPDVLLAAPA